MENNIRQIRNWVIFFMIALFLSGLTAIPVVKELEIVSSLFPVGSSIGNWLDEVLIACREMQSKYPFLFYGYDWLAFAHFLFAILFIGPLKDPEKNKWVFEFGIIACCLIIPFAFIAGQFRGIPMWWRLIDCSFGVVGLIPLYICLKKIKQMKPGSESIDLVIETN
jgi:hypothetical protein